MAIFNKYSGRLRRGEKFFLVSMLALAYFPALAGAENNPRILLLLSNNDRAYELAAGSVRDNLLRVAGRTISFDIKKFELPVESGSTLSNLLRKRFDLIITIGTDAARATRFTAGKAPVLNIMTTKDAFESIWGQRKDGSGKVSAVYLEQPADRQLKFINLVLPHNKNCGVLLGNRSSHLSTDLNLAASGTRLELNIVDISVSRKPIDAIRDIIEDNDVILVLPGTDGFTPNVAKWLLYMAYQREIPVIGFSKALVDAGALGAVHTTPEQIGRQAAEIVFRAAINSSGKTDKPWRLPSPQYPRYFDVSINGSVARTLKLNLQPDYLAQSLLNLEQAESWRAQN
jgi:ABC-type uncharacterized transport system substrate-binding protein